ncbi:MAG: hypothetical protein Q4D77_02005 [Peptostreptococcaceae bacterium]|nr:hypothetical protein [Peptostreptococcaceae bacterium]
MEYIFQITRIDAENKEKQVSKMLEKRVEIISRSKAAPIWRITDRLNQNRSSSTISEEVRKKRRARMKIWSILLILLGIFLIVPALMDPRGLLMPLLFGGLLILYGITNLTVSKESSQIFDQAAKNLLKNVGEATDVQLIFRKDGFLMPESDLVSYDKLEFIFESEDLFGILQDGMIMILQKKDLLHHDMTEFTTFLRGLVDEEHYIQTMQ